MKKSNLLLIFFILIILFLFFSGCKGLECKDFENPKKENFILGTGEHTANEWCIE